MSRIGDLKGLMGALLTLAFFYSLALLIVIPIGFLVGMYICSIFGNELFTQEIYFIIPGMFFIIVSGIIDLLWMIGMIGIRAGFKSSVNQEKDREFSRNNWILYSIIAVMALLSFIASGILIFKDYDTFYSLTFCTGVLMAFLVLRWKVIDIPANALRLLGNEKGLRWSRISTVPLVIFIFSAIPLMLSFRYEDAPTETILVVYLEVLFALSVLINLVNIGGIVKEIGSEIGHLKKNNESDPGSRMF